MSHKTCWHCTFCFDCFATYKEYIDHFRTETGRLDFTTCTRAFH